MKSNTTFIFAGIMSAIIGNAYATGENIVTSKSYVDAQDALKQDLINVDMMELEGAKGTFTFPTLVSYDNTDNLIGTKYAILSDTTSQARDVIFSNNKDSFVIPTLNFLDTQLSKRQTTIPASGHYGTEVGGFFNSIDSIQWLNSDIKGTGLVTKTSTNGVVGERKIFEATDVANYHNSQLSANAQAIQDISIPTVGAMMTAISNGVNAATPTGTPNTIANYGANGELDSGIATYTGAAAYNATNDSAKIPTMAGVTTYAQAKKTCAGWPDGTTTYDTTHTDANCWLWTFPD